MIWICDSSLINPFLPGCSAGPSDLWAIAGKEITYLWSPSDQGAVTFVVCGYITETCGTIPDSNQCWENATNCAVACQTWVDQANGPQGATLGTVTDLCALLLK